jgi:RNA polymerase sigma factor (TIGR02999 family)
MATDPATTGITRLLRAYQQGDQDAAGELFPRVYDQLRVLARQRMAQESPNHTLQPTALVHEVYVRLAAGQENEWANRRHFYFAAAEAMRRILIDYARARKSLKRGGGRKRTALENVLDLAAEPEPQQILALDEAILRLGEVSETVAVVVRLRFYAGLTIEETAEALGISPRSVKREWTFARAWLFRELRRADE